MIDQYSANSQNLDSLGNIEILARTHLIKMANTLECVLLQRKFVPEFDYKTSQVARVYL